jgi:hypothetical protein
VSGQHHAPATLPPGKTRYPLYRRLGGPHGRSGCVRKITPSTGIRPPDRSACSQSLYRLSYPGPYHEHQYGTDLHKILYYGRYDRSWSNLIFVLMCPAQSVRHISTELVHRIEVRPAGGGGGGGEKEDIFIRTVKSTGTVFFRQTRGKMIPEREHCH